MKILRTVFILASLVYLSSCGSSRKGASPEYLEKVNDTTLKAPFKALRIQKNDQLSIQVYSSSTDPKADALYNLPSGGEGTSNAGGFLVDDEGNIEYPRLGTIHAEGLTKQQLAAEIKKRLTEPVVLLNNPTVIIRFLNYKVTMLGMVSRVGLIQVPGEKITILEAIGLAGGITDYGKKDRIKIMREQNNQLEVAYVNITSDSLFQSPYYYLMQNDVIIVEPTRQKMRQEEQSVVSQRISIALGIITSAAFIYNIFK